MLLKNLEPKQNPLLHILIMMRKVNMFWLGSTISISGLLNTIDGVSSQEGECALEVYNRINNR